MFVVKSINNCRSVIATKNIKNGTVLFTEEISFMVDKKIDNWYELLIEHELKNNNDIFFDLVPHETDCYCFSDAVYSSNKIKLMGKNPQLVYNKIIRNAFNVKIGNKIYATILYKGRLFNHSCVPNVLFDVIKKNGKTYMNFFACKDIVKGEELTDNYFDVNLSYSKRQYISKTFYGFVCKCAKCTKSI